MSPTTTLERRGVTRAVTIERLLKLHRRTYPREWVGPTDLARVYNLLGQSEQAMSEARESIRLNPDFSGPYWSLALGLLRLNRVPEAEDIFAQALRRGLDNRYFRFYLYQFAFINGDTTGMRQQIDWTRGKPEEYVAFDWQAQAAAFTGNWRKAQDFSRRAIEMTARGDTQELAALYATEQALRGTVFGGCRQARADAAQGLKLARGRASLPRAALALTLCGQANQAKSLVDEMIKLYPEDTLINSIWTPAIHAAMNLQRGASSNGAAQAIEQPQTASRYEAAAEFWPQYLRGLALMKLGRGAEAATEFQKILEHRGCGTLSVLYPLAHLGSARAAAMVGDRARSRKAFEDLFAVWKMADPDLPILLEAKRDYEKIR